MKKLLILLLAVAMLLSLAITAYADDGSSGEVIPTESEAAPTPSEPEASQPVTILPDGSELPPGFEIDPDFSMTITLDSESDWRFILSDLLTEAEDGEEYYYFFVEEDVAEGYTAMYALGNSLFSTETPPAGTGNIVVVKNVKKGEPPIYELPNSGGPGPMPYIVAGAAILMFATVFCMILDHKRKMNAQ